MPRDWLLFACNMGALIIRIGSEGFGYIKLYNIEEPLVTIYAPFWCPDLRQTRHDNMSEIAEPVPSARKRSQFGTALPVPSKGASGFCGGAPLRGTIVGFL